MAKVDTDSIVSTYRIADILARYGHQPAPRTRGRKFCCPLPGHTDSDPSFSVFNTNNGERFKCHSCGAGGDVIQLVQLLEGCEMREAADIITGKQTPTEQPDKPKKPKAPTKMDRLFDGTFTVCPKDQEPTEWIGGRTFRVLNAAGKDVGHTCEAVYRYRNSQGELECIAGRHDLGKGKKKVVPYRWDPETKRWWNLGYTEIEARPIYGAERLAKHPHLPVLVVEGEKCVDYLQPTVEDKLVVVSWLGGGGQVELADWKLLEGRDVTTWEDFDYLDPKRPEQTERTGHITMRKLHEILKTVGVKRLRKVDIGDFTEAEYKDGYDVADMMSGRKPKTGAQVLEWMRARLVDVDAPAPADEPEDEEDDPSSRMLSTSKWLPPGGRLEMGTGKNRGMVLPKDENNAAMVLMHHPAFKGRIAYDVFDQVELFDGKPINHMALLQLRGELMAQRPKISLETGKLRPIVMAIAYATKVNNFARQLSELTWDGKLRLQAEDSLLNDAHKGLLVEYANVEDTPFTRVIGMRWMVGLARRIMQDPNNQRGYQHDSVLVLEGDQGFRKTSFLRVLGSVFGREAYTELTGSLGKDKDDIMKLKGKCIVELAEMSAHRKSDQGLFKDFISRKVDEYRPPYAVDPVKAPRMMVFAGTTNQDRYLTDPTGNRRIWPCTVTSKIDTARLEEDLEQIWAEAVHLAMDPTVQTYLTEEEELMHADATSGRALVEAWEFSLQELLELKEKGKWPVDGIPQGEVWMKLGIVNVVDRTPSAQARLVDIMRKHGIVLAPGNGKNGQSQKDHWRIKRAYTQKQKLTPRS